MLAVGAVAALFADRLRLAALVVAVITATALERHRQATRPTPLTLTATPHAWRQAIETTIGLRTTVLAVGLIGAAALVLTQTRLGSSTTTVHTAQPAPAGVGAARLPVLPIRTYPSGHSFTVAGANFRVSPDSSAAWATSLRRSSAGKRLRWVVVQVDTTNLSRHHFDPNDLDYRLRDQRGAVYYADMHGGTGPASLSTPGLLRPGLTAESRLGFRVPRGTGPFTVVFEPVIGGPIQVHVDLVPFRAPRRTG